QGMMCFRPSAVQTEWRYAPSHSARKDFPEAFRRGSEPPVADPGRWERAVTQVEGPAVNSKARSSMLLKNAELAPSRVWMKGVSTKRVPSASSRNHATG